MPLNAEKSFRKGGRTRHSALVAWVLVGVAVFWHCGRSSSSPIALSISPSSFPNLTLGAPNELLLAANGGVAPYRWSISAGSLPHNTSLTSAGGSARISGTPDTAQGVTFTIQVTDSAHQSASRAYTVAVLTADPEGKNR